MTLTNKLYKRDPNKYPTTTPKITALKLSNVKAMKAMAIPNIMQSPKLTFTKSVRNEYKINPRIAQFIKTEFVFQKKTPKIMKYNPIKIKIPAKPCLGIPN